MAEGSSASPNPNPIPETIEQEDGFDEFPVGDVNKLAYYIERLIVDKSLRNSMGLSAKDHYTKRYSSEVFVLNHEKLYSKKLEL